MIHHVLRRVFAAVAFVSFAPAALAQMGTLELTTSANPAVFGQELTLSARVVNGMPPYTSNIFRFRKGGTTLCTAPVQADGTGSCDVTASGPLLPIGTHTLDVQYEPGMTGPLVSG